MRKLGTLALLTVLVVGAASVCWAETVPAIPYKGDAWTNANGAFRAVHLYCRDRSESTGYVGPDGTYTRAGASDPWVGVTDLPDPAGNFEPGESTWGIFAVRILEAGNTQVANEIFKKLGGDLTYQWDETNIITADTALVGMFYGGWDKKVVLTNSGATLEVLVQSVHFELWAVDEADVNLLGASQGPGYDSNFRTAANRYTDWVEGGGTCLVTGVSTYYRFVGTQQISPFLAFDGETVAYFDVSATDTTGLWNKDIGNNAYFTDPDGGVADLKMSFDISAGTDGWTANSYDDGGFGFAVPEPLTLMGLVVSAAGVGNYLRRRRLVVAKA